MPVNNLNKNLMKTFFLLSLIFLGISCPLLSNPFIARTLSNEAPKEP